MQNCSDDQIRFQDREEGRRWRERHPFSLLEV